MSTRLDLGPAIGQTEAGVNTSDSWHRGRYDCDSWPRMGGSIRSTRNGSANAGASRSEPAPLAHLPTEKPSGLSDGRAAGSAETLSSRSRRRVGGGGKL